MWPAPYPIKKKVHDFRRTAARNLERAGVSRSVAMGMIVHKTESMYRRYRFVDEVRSGEEAEKLQAWATGQQKPTKAGGWSVQEAGVSDVITGTITAPVISWDVTEHHSAGSSKESCGGMAEWSMAVVLKTTEPGTVPGVRIPLPPPNQRSCFLSSGSQIL